MELSKRFSREHWELADQLRRAALSVCLNIAEGSAKFSDKDFKRFVENSLGSINESLACLDIALDNSLITHDSFENVKVLAESIAKQLGGLAKKLRSSYTS
ncbi:MAG: four helix bundle protein [Cyanobacteriota bacterium]